MCICMHITTNIDIQSPNSTIGDMSNKMQPQLFHRMLSTDSAPENRGSNSQPVGSYIAQYQVQRTAQMLYTLLFNRIPS